MKRAAIVFFVIAIAIVLLIKYAAPKEGSAVVELGLKAKGKSTAQS
ncbi:MAG TPA: hypothetical protein VET25_03295 [Aestuariivirgaceae bacterium]|nr:hypothetical protein [Aestuariivirgaceae bacterium]